MVEAMVPEVGAERGENLEAGGGAIALRFGCLQKAVQKRVRLAEFFLLGKQLLHLVQDQEPTGVGWGGHQQALGKFVQAGVGCQLPMDLAQMSKAGGILDPLAQPRAEGRVRRVLVTGLHGADQPAVAVREFGNVPGPEAGP